MRNAIWMNALRATAPVLLALLLSSAASAAARQPVPELERLPNGLQLVWFVKDTLPVVDLALLVRSGERDDPAGKSGTAELLAASLDRGSGGMTAQQMARAVEMLGASRYASSDDDAFSVGMHGLAPDAPALLELLTRMALKPDLAETEVQREHARILDRWSHLGDYGEALVSVAYRRVLGAGTSYARGGFASVREFASVGVDDVKAFHRRHFTPANSVLMIVGRVDKPALRQRILQLMGTPEAWSGGEPPRSWKPYSDKRLKRVERADGHRVLVVHRPNLTQAQVRIGFRAPLLQAPQHYALVVANALLGEYFNSRLNLYIRDKLGLTYGIGSSFAYSRELGTFTIASSTRNETVGQLIARAQEVLRGLKSAPVPAEEIEMAKEYLVGGFPLGTATLEGVASRWLTGYLYGLGPEYLNEFVPKVREVTPQQVHQAVARDFPLDRMVIAIAGDAVEIEKSLAASGIRGAVRLGVDDLR